MITFMIQHPAMQIECQQKTHGIIKNIKILLTIKLRRAAAAALMILSSLHPPLLLKYD
jgi:hypothetical protein